MAHSRALSTMALLAAATLSLAGCKNKSNPTGTQGNSSLAGTYSMVSVTFQGQPTVGPPIATGTMTLTDSTYSVSISITIPGQEQTIQDAGTYTVSGNNWTQTSTTQNIQSVGTFTLTGNTLTVNVSTAGQQVSTVWQRQ